MQIFIKGMDPTQPADSLWGCAPTSANDVAATAKTEAVSLSLAVITKKCEKKTAQKNAETEALENLLIGFNIEEQGVYMGVLDIAGKKFILFAAPEDLTDESNKKVLSSYINAAKEVAGKRNWHGHDGACIKNEAELYKALIDGSCEGRWFVPTKSMLGLLFDNNDKDAFRKTFTITNTLPGAHWYLSCSENPNNPAQIWFTRFSAGDGNWLPKDGFRLSCRPCRAVEVKQLTL